MISCNRDSYDGLSICVLARVERKDQKAMARIALMLVPVSFGQGGNQWETSGRILFTTSCVSWASYLAAHSIVLDSTFAKYSFCKLFQFFTQIFNTNSEYS